MIISLPRIHFRIVSNPSLSTNLLVRVVELVTWVVPTRITEHFGSDSSNIFKHLNDSKNNKNKTTRENAFKILDDARTDYELALKEGLHIKWFKPALNKQKAHEVITLSV